MCVHRDHVDARPPDADVALAKNDHAEVAEMFVHKSDLRARTFAKQRGLK